MTKTDIATDYDNLLTDLNECPQALSVVWDWSNRDIDPGNRLTVFSFFQEHGSHLAILNLVMGRLDDLVGDHHQRVDKAFKEASHE